MEIFLISLGSISLIFIVIRLSMVLIRKLIELPKISINDKWIVVSGCDSGIGKLSIENLINEGANVIALSYTKEGSENALAIGWLANFSSSAAKKSACGCVNSPNS